MTADELIKTQIARFVDRQPDWDAFADARVDGYRRAQHRYIGAGASGKSDPRAIAAEHFTLSVMFVPPGQRNAAHTHEVEEGRREETGRARPDLMSYADPALQAKRDVHLGAARA